MTSGSKSALVLLGGMLLGAGIVAGMYEMRGKGIRTPPVATTPAPDPFAPPPGTGTGTAPAPAPAEVAALQARITELEAILKDPQQLEARMKEAMSAGVNAEQGMTTDDAWWEKMPRVPAWDEPQRQKIVDQLAKNAGVKLDPSKVDCRKRCCRIVFTEEQLDQHEAEIFSSVGLQFDHADSYGSANDGKGSVTVTSCWKVDQTAAVPDRAAERAALMAKVAGAVKACGQGGGPKITLTMRLHLDVQGEISKVESNKEQLGHASAACAEAAIVEAADFAPSPVVSFVPIIVALGGA